MLIHQLPLDGAFWTLRSTPAGLSPTDSMIYRQATTACLMAIVLMQVVNVHLCRSRRTSIFSLPLWSNGLITAGIVTEIVLILLIDYTAAGDALFGTAPIGWRVWAIMLPFPAGLLMFEEARKALARSIAPSTA